MNRQFWLNLLERAAKTGVQVAAALLLAGAPLDLISAPWVRAVSAGGMAALLSAVTSLLMANVVVQSPILDLIVRAVKTAGQTFLTAAVAGGFGLLDMPWRVSLLAALTAAVGSVLTSWASLNVGTPGTPSMVKAA